MMRISCVLLVILLSPGVLFASTAPRFNELNMNLDDLVPLIEKHQVLLLHKPQPISVTLKKKKQKSYDARFVSGMTIVNAPVETVKGVIMDFAHYQEFMPQLAYAKILSESEGHKIIKQKIVIELPVVNLGTVFTLDFYNEPDGGISWTLIKGDMDASEGRWELIALPDNRTLLINTLWTDMKSMGFLLGIILKAQPELELAVPISVASVALDAVKRRVEMQGEPKAPEASELPAAPRMPLLTEGNADLGVIAQLAQKGTVIFVHPKQWIHKNDETVGLVFVSGCGVVHAPIEPVKKLQTDFPRYPEFFKQVKSASIAYTDEGMTADWRLWIHFGIFKVGVDYTLGYMWKSENQLMYQRVHGELEHNYGAWEWLPLELGSTLVLQTIAAQTGRNDSFLLKLSNLLPNHQIVMGASTNIFIIENQIPWIEKELKAE